MRLESWDPSAGVRYDRRLWNELVDLRFLDGPHGALILGPVGVGKTHLATALGHIAVRRRRTVHMARADKLFKRLTAARLDNTLDYEIPPPHHRRPADHRPIRGSQPPVGNVSQRGLSGCFRTSACRYPRSHTNVGDVGMICGHGGAACHARRAADLDGGG